MELHWFDAPEQVVFKLVVTMFCCVHGQAPQWVTLTFDLAFR